MSGWGTRPPGDALRPAADEREEVEARVEARAHDRRAQPARRQAPRQHSAAHAALARVVVVGCEEIDGFDAVFNEADGNVQIYAACLQPVVLGHVFDGGSATVFAFGQTGSGKTCTMAGHGDASAADGNTRFSVPASSRSLANQLQR